MQTRSVRWIGALFAVLLVSLTLTAAASADVSFIKAYGWGVSDGASKFETCTSTCQAGIAGAGVGQLSYPSAVATNSSGDVYVLDGRIYEFSAAGVFIKAIGNAGSSLSGAGQFALPAGVATDSSGDVYVDDSYNNRIDEFSAAGAFIKAYGWGVADGAYRFETCTSTCQAGWAGGGAGQFAVNSGGVATNSAGDVYVTDPDNARIDEFSAAGSFIEAYGWGVGDPQKQYGICGSYQCDRFETCTSICQRGIVGGGAGQFYGSGGVATDSSGDVYVSDVNNYRIDEFSAAGAFIKAYGWGVSDGASRFETCTSTCRAGTSGPGAGQLDEPYEVATDSSGDVYVADSFNYRIDEFSAAGAFITAIGTGGGGAGQLRVPEGVATDSSGDVYVADTYNNRIDEFGSCDQVSDRPDGTWDFGGCFGEPSDTSFDDSQGGSVNLDGLVLDPGSGDSLDFSDGGSSGDELTGSGGSSTLDLDLTGLDGESSTPPGSLAESGKTLVKLAQLRSFAWKLSGGAVTVPLSPNVSVAGLSLSGTMTLTPDSSGTVTGTASGTLPAILGGGKATVTVTSTYAGGVTALDAKASTASLGQLLALKNVDLSFSGGRWHVSGSVIGLTGVAGSLSGTLQFGQSGQLTAGQLSVNSVSLAGFTELKAVALSYSPSSGWSGSAEVGGGSQNASMKLDFSAAGALTSGYLHASGVSLFGVLPMKTFNLDWNGDETWELSVEPNIPGGTTASADLSVQDGGITGASLSLGKVGFAGGLSLDELSLNYSNTAGEVSYGGKWQVTLPSPLNPTVSGAVQFINGAFASGNIDLQSKTGVPLGWGVYLHEVGASLTLKPFEIAGTLGVSLGPRTPAGSALALDGSLTYDTDPSTYTLSGALAILGTTLGSATMTTSEATDTINLTLGKGDGSEGLHLGSLLSLHGTATGSISNTSESLTGSADFTVSGHKLIDGNLAMNQTGIAACSTAGDGFTWTFGQNPVVHWDSTCKLAGY